MATSLQFALSNPTPGQEEEFNRWYGADHLLHGLETPAVMAAQRFRRIPGPGPAGKHDYLMIWEFDDPDLALEELAKVKGTDAMPLSEAIDMSTVQPPTMWRRASVRTAARVAVDTASRGTCVLALANPLEGADEAFVAEVMGGGLARLADLPGVVAADFLTLADQQIRGNARKYRYGLLLELHDEAAGLASLNTALPALPHLNRDSWLAPAFRPLARRMTKAEALANARA
jgi:hypothetical protein